MSIGRNIAAERKKHGFSQEDIAILVGVSRQAVSKWERDISSPSTDNIIRLAEMRKDMAEYKTGDTGDWMDNGVCSADTGQ